jgi:hypothetical protein
MPMPMISSEYAGRRRGESRRSYTSAPAIDHARPAYQAMSAAARQPRHGSTHEVKLVATPPRDSPGGRSRWPHDGNNARRSTARRP